MVGLRYVRFDNRLIYSALGETTIRTMLTRHRFFSSNDKIKNNLFGPQAGFDLWWNMTAGVNLGIGHEGSMDAERCRASDRPDRKFARSPRDAGITVELTETERHGR